MIYSSFGRYGVALDGAWMANTDYSDPRVKKVLLLEYSSIFLEMRTIMVYFGKEQKRKIFR